MNETLCPKIEYTLTLLGKKWTGLIIYTLQKGAIKFSEIEKFIPGLSARLLQERLKELEKERIITKTVYSNERVVITYGLTKKGEELAKTFHPLFEWSEKWI